MVTAGDILDVEVQTVAVFGLFCRAGEPSESMPPSPLSPLPAKERAQETPGLRA
jgi:hypothetical protein